MAMTVDQWLDGYRDAWERRDPAAAAALFSEDSLYREQPYQAPFPGREGVRDYWTTVTATQDDVRVRYGSPVSVGNRAAVEWWVTMRNGGADVTLPESSCSRSTRADSALIQRRSCEAARGTAGGSAHGVALPPVFPGSPPAGVEAACGSSWV